MEFDSSKKVVLFLIAIALVASIATYFVLSSVSDTEFYETEDQVLTSEVQGTVVIDVISPVVESVDGGSDGATT